MPMSRASRSNPVRSLVLLNAGLLVVLAGVSFVPKADAQQALAAFGARGVEGVVAEVQTFCLD